MTTAEAPWRLEIVELHELFEDYFLGRADSLSRVEDSLADDFLIVGPAGAVANRAETLEALRLGHAHTAALKINISESTLVEESGDLIVASYIESHELALSSNRRLTTVVFRRVASAPNGLQWVRVHETWLDRADDQQRRSTG